MQLSNIRIANEGMIGYQQASNQAEIIDEHKEKIGWKIRGDRMG